MLACKFSKAYESISCPSSLLKNLASEVESLSVETIDDPIELKWTLGVCFYLDDYN